MTRSIFSLVFCSLVLCFSQAALCNESDWVTISEIDKPEINFQFRYEEDNPILFVKIQSTDIQHVTPENTLIFLSNKGSMTQLRPSKDTEVTTLENGDKLLEISYRGNIDFFKEHTVSTIRLNYDGGEISLPVSQKVSNEITNLYNKFISADNITLQGDYARKTEIKFFEANYNGQWVLKKTIFKVLTKAETDEIVNEWKSKSNEKKTYDCVVITNFSK